MSVTRGQCDARPTVTFPAARHHRPLAGAKLYCLVTDAHVCVNNLPRVALDSRAAGIRTRSLLIACGGGPSDFADATVCFVCPAMKQAPSVFTSFMWDHKPAGNRVTGQRLTVM